jgi:hypothetical protein
MTPSTTPGALITGEFTDRRAPVTALAIMSATPSTGLATCRLRR